MRVLSGLVLVTLLLMPDRMAHSAPEPAAVSPPISEESKTCMGCHEAVTPGIVADWKTSRHAKITPAAALKQPAMARRISAKNVPPSLGTVAVGCYECHGLNPADHADNFAHQGHRINVIVSPNDCAICHPTEAQEYAGSKKAHAIANLDDNPLYHQLVETVVGKSSDVHGAGGPAALKGTCKACHGTEITVRGMKTVVDDDGDEIQVPDLANWPNHGVGRINPDGSRGACTACHPRHGFSIEVARKPHTCAQCHLAPDTPAWEVWRESKHGNIALSLGDDWHWNDVPWAVGEDFRTPTCATCHNALVVTPDGEEIAPRTHDFGARLWVRIFGLPYAHPQPKSGATSTIRNADGQPLPTTFAGVPASEHLIDAATQAERKTQMQAICRGCHSTRFAEGHFAQLDGAIEETNRVTQLATDAVLCAWKSGAASPTNPFDELIEMKWVQQWLFYATSVRYAAAMGGPDYGGFKNGWWSLTRNLLEIEKLAGDACKRAPAKH